MRLLLNVVVAGTIVAGTTVADSSRARPVDRAPAPADTVKEYRGQYETGFEVSWFRPCDATRGDDRWWVTLTDDALRQRDSLAAKLPEGRVSGPVFVRWRGTTSMKMPAGHGGLGTRYMLVSEVLEVRLASEGSCSSA